MIIPQDLCPEESAFCLLNNLLVNGLRWVVHDHSALLVVDLGVNPGVADEVDNPLLALILAQTETSGQVPKGMSEGVSLDLGYQTHLISIRW